MTFSHTKFMRRYKPWARKIGRGAQSRLAEKSGYQPPMVSQIINDRAVPSLGGIRRLAKVLKCEPSDLCLKGNGR